MKQFQVNKKELSKYRVVQSEDLPLTQAGVAFEVERFAFTANNLTYFMMGDKLGYWQFFPPINSHSTKNNNEENWGVIPVWGIGKVTASSVEGVDIGSRYFGYFPPATHLHTLFVKLGTES